MAGQRAWAPVGSPVSTPPLRGCIRSAVVNPPQARGGNRADGRHDDPTGWGRLYMIPSSNCSEALFLPLCFHSGLPLTARARLFFVALSSLRCIVVGRMSRRFCHSISTPVARKFSCRNRLYRISCRHLPGAADWAQGLPGGAPKDPRPKHIKNNIATNRLLNGPQEPI